MRGEYIYLFQMTNHCKLGRTSETPFIRLESSYKHARPIPIGFYLVENSKPLETILLMEFRKYYKRDIEMGTESFQGDPQEMRKTILDYFHSKRIEYYDVTDYSKEELEEFQNNPDLFIKTDNYTVLPVKDNINAICFKKIFNSQCERCHTTVSSRKTYIAHLKNTKCESIFSQRTQEQILESLKYISNSDVINCVYCNMIFKNGQQRDYHYNICYNKQNKEREEYLSIEKQLQEKDELILSLQKHIQSLTNIIETHSSQTH